MPLRRHSALLLSLLLPAAALAFWGKKTDEERLKAKLDSLKVHLYLGQGTSKVPGGVPVPRSSSSTSVHVSFGDWD